MTIGLEWEKELAENILDFAQKKELYAVIVAQVAELAQLDLSGMALTLYHATSEYAADQIEREGFRCGTHGFAGGAIYFSKNPDGACRKYKNGRGNPDILIECIVRSGRMLEAAKHTVDAHDVRCRGCDSATRIF